MLREGEDEGYKSCQPSPVYSPGEYGEIISTTPSYPKFPKFDCALPQVPESSLYAGHWRIKGFLPEPSYLQHEILAEELTSDDDEECHNGLQMICTLSEGMMASTTSSIAFTSGANWSDELDCDELESLDDIESFFTSCRR